MTSEHTPGPWFYERDFDYYLIETEDGHAVVTGKDNTEGNEADYRLIAAAPDLLEALRDMVALVRDVAPQYAESTVAANARAAIAKAEGRS